MEDPSQIVLGQSQYKGKFVRQSLSTVSHTEKDPLSDNFCANENFYEAPTEQRQHSVWADYLWSTSQRPTATPNHFIASNGFYSRTGLECIILVYNRWLPEAAHAGTFSPSWLPWPSETHLHCAEAAALLHPGIEGTPKQRSNTQPNEYCLHGFYLANESTAHTFNHSRFDRKCDAVQRVCSIRVCSIRMHFMTQWIRKLHCVYMHQIVITSEICTEKSKIKVKLVTQQAVARSTKIILLWSKRVAYKTLNSIK